MANENPFTLSPDPRYFFLTDALREAADKVRYVCDSRNGLTVLYGDVGMGKSSLLRLLYSEYAGRPDCRVALIPTPDFDTGLALLKAIGDEFGVSRKRSRLDQQKEFENFLLDEYSNDRNVIVFVDEAQVLTGRVLELVRTLLNFETDRAKLVQVVLAGQLELRDRLRDKSKRALRSRIFTSSVLSPLTPDATAAMIAFRCERAGVPNPFPSPAADSVFRWTRGVPRDVMKVCGLAYSHVLLGVPVTAELIDEVAPDAELETDAD